MSQYELDCKWHFPKLSKSDGHEGPNSAMSQTFSTFPCYSLVRESIQNSLDAQLDQDKPVRVCFEYRSLDKYSYKSFFNLRDHIQGCLDNYPTIKSAKLIYPDMLNYMDRTDEIGFIRVSDYNTRGMDYVEGETDKTFYAFVRAAGVSVKQDDGSGGSFGFGKGAFFVMSPINTVFVSTMNSDNQCFFEGVSRLCTQKIDGEHYSHMGFYDNNGGLPVSDPERIPIPFRRKEPGTGISIMGVQHSEWNGMKEELVKEVLRNFFVAIEERKLVVVIDGNDGTEKDSIMIDKSHLANLMNQYFTSTLEKRSRGTSKSYNPRPYYEAYIQERTDKTYFEATLPVLGDVRMYVKEFDNNSTNIIFMRSPYMKVFKEGRNTGNYNCVFICDDENGNKVLGDMEDPQHQEWNADRCNKTELKTSYEDANTAAIEINKFISSCFDKLLDLNSSDAVQVANAEKYLYTMDDPKVKGEKGNPFFGVPTGNYVKEGASLTTDGAVKPMDPKKKKKGNVISLDDNKFEHDDEGKDTGGTGGSNGGTGGGTSGGGNNFGKGKIIEGGGQMKALVEVEWRPVISKKQGFMDIVIYSDRQIDNAELHFAIGRESSSRKSKEDVSIIHSSKGTSDGLIVTGVDIKKDAKNIIQVAFSDKMPHTLTLGVYETI